MNKVNIAIITKSEELPRMQCRNFFHSCDLFRIIENTPGQKPYMAIAYNDRGDIIGHMLVMLRRRGSLIPPYLFTQARIYGEGEYSTECDRETVFGCMLQKMVRRLRMGTCLYIEFSDLSTKMFGYAKFRENGFFPVHWMEIHNSLHSMNPARRLTTRMRKLIIRARKSGLSTKIAKTNKEYNDFFKILKNYVTLKIRRFIPDSKLFTDLFHNSQCNLFTTYDDNKITSGCFCVYSEDNCYLWYMASKRNLHKRRANAMTVWTAIKHAYDNKYRHIYFMDVGLPFKKNRFREFILDFGGKPVGTFRWFRCSFKWINNILSWLYRE